MDRARTEFRDSFVPFLRHELFHLGLDREDAVECTTTSRSPGQ
jgi:hypothetical protein